MRHIIFGESHGPAIGVVLEQVPPGIKLDQEAITREMARRAPGKNDLSTSRKEADIPRILSGVFEGRTTGTPLCAVIENTDQKSKDYEKTRYLARPSHGDYTGYLRYDGFNDYRGGGHFSGRLTAPLVFWNSKTFPLAPISARLRTWEIRPLRRKNCPQNCFARSATRHSPRWTTTRESLCRSASGPLGRRVIQWVALSNALF